MKSCEFGQRRTELSIHFGNIALMHVFYGANRCYGSEYNIPISIPFVRDWRTIQMTGDGRVLGFFTGAAEMTNLSKLTLVKWLGAEIEIIGGKASDGLFRT